MKTFKHFLAALLLMCSTVVSAHDFEVDGIYYNILSVEDKTVEVTYKGTYSSEYSNEYTDNVIIPENVTYNSTIYIVASIGESAFFACSRLAGVEISNSVTSIGENAFYDCYRLESIVVGKNVASIGRDAFYGCSKLNDVYISDIVAWCSIEFSGSYLPNKPLSLTRNYSWECDDSNPLYYAENLYLNGELVTELVIPDGVNEIKNFVFYGYSGLTSVKISNSVTRIGDAAFSDCSRLSNVEIPNGVINIGSEAFCNCISLTNIEIPNSVTSIENAAFFECKNLTSITIGNGVVYVGSLAFYCSGIQRIYISDIAAWCGIEFSDYYELPKNLYLNGELLTELIIPDGVTEIKDGAFYACNGLTSIEIPSSVTSIERNAFNGCSSLTSIKSHIPAEDLFDVYFDSADKMACTLYVPIGAKETYWTKNGWSEFYNVVEFEEVFDLTVSTAGYATLYLDYAAEIPADVEVYTANAVEGDRLKMQPVEGVIPANTGVIVKAAPGTYSFTQTEATASAILGNLFCGSVMDKNVKVASDAKVYVLSMVDGEVGMYRAELTDHSFLNNANKAYLLLAGKNLGVYDEEWDTSAGGQLSNGYRFDFGGITGIDEVNNELKGESGEVKTIYDLSGRVVENPSKGLYIINGKKVMVK